MTGGAAGLILVVASRPGSPERRLELAPAGTTVIGSSQERADIVLAAPGLADAHCAIGRVKRGGWALRDLGAPGGSRVNGRSVDSARLGHGDRIELGELTLRVLDPGLEPAPTDDGAPPENVEHAPSGPDLIEPDEIRLDVTAPTPVRRIGGYRIVRGLGRGATGSVVLAVQESLDREVALKLLSPALARDREFVERFQHEARAAASLNHANVVVVYDVGEAAGQHFLSMEYMDGESLERRLATGPLPWREVVRILIDAAHGLEYAEQRGIVHRDIKPANLMRNHAGATKIADLGLATPVAFDSAASGGGPGSTGSSYGTAHFVSPEQARGGPVDNRSDLYSLGATAFRLLTSHTPFEGNSQREILRAVFHEVPPLVTDFVPDVPHALVALVARLLAKDPDERPRSARELSFELTRLSSAAPHADPAAGVGAGAAAGAHGRATKVVLAVAVLALVATVWVVARIALSRTAIGEPERSAPSATAAGTPPAFRALEFEDVPVDSTDESATSGDSGDVGRGNVRPGGKARVAEPGVASRVDPLATLEAEARDALAALPETSDPGARRGALEALVARYRGTTAAAEAEAELAAPSAGTAGAPDGSPGTDARSLAVTRALDALRAETGIDGPAFSIAGALRSVRSFRPPVALLDDAELEAGRRRLVDEVLSAALARVELAWRRADAAAAEGDFARVESELDQAARQLEVPALSAAAAPEEPADPSLPSPPSALPGVAFNEEVVRPLIVAEERLRRRLDALPDEQQRWRAALEERDAIARAKGLAGLEGELRGMQLSTAEKRLRQLASSLVVDAEIGRVSRLADDLANARAALAALASALGADEWRRHAIPDPRARRRQAQIVGAAPDGWLCRAGESVEVLPHGLFAAEPSALDGLFTGRLTRSYTHAELQGIVHLVRAAAVLAALDALEPALAASPPSLEPDRARALSEGYAYALEWATELDDDRTGREVRAFELLSGALTATGRRAWSVAERLLKELARDYPDTLLVMLLSDGRKLERDAGEATGSDTDAEAGAADSGESER